MSAKPITKTQTIALNIPDAWLMGFCHPRFGFPERTIKDAVAYWHKQARLEADFHRKLRG